MMGTVWMMLLRLAERSIGLVSTLILARLLTPADFGLVAMATAVLALIELMSAFGFDVVLIQRKDADRVHYDTAWTFNLLFGIATAILLIAMALPAAGFYHEPRLSWILVALSAGALAQGFANVGTVAFRKEMNFRKEFYFMVSKKLASFVITMALALIYRSYWALVGGIVTGKLFSVWISYRIHPYRPKFTLAGRHDLFHFSKWLFISNFVVFLQNRSADFILGRTVGAHGLGLYNIAFEIATLPSTELIAPLNRAVFPAYSQLSDNLPELRAKFIEVFGIIALTAIPVSAGLACLAEPAVLVLLGDQWRSAIPLLRLFTMAGLIGALQSNLHLVLVAIGNPKANTMVSTGLLIISMPVFIPMSLYYGPIGAAWTFLFFSLLGLLAIQKVFLNLTGIALKDYLATLWRPFLSSLAMAAILFGANDLIFIHTGNLVRLLGLVFLGMLSYSAVIIATWKLSGKPKGGEVIVIEFVHKRWYKITGSQAV